MGPKRTKRQSALFPGRADICRPQKRDKGQCQALPLIDQLEREKGDILLEQPQKDFVPLPQRQLRKAGLFHPHQLALVALLLLPGKARGREQVHVFGGPSV